MNKDPQTDPTLIDWVKRQADAWIPFTVVDGRPVNPNGKTGISRGRNLLWHWGEGKAADAVVTATDEEGYRWMVMVKRGDGLGWALPGGGVNSGEDPLQAAIRELQEETGLVLPGASWQILPARYVPDPRASDEAWMVTVVARTHLGTLRRDDFPLPVGADDADLAEWVRADDYPTLVAYLKEAHQGRVFAAHEALLAELL